MRTFLILFILIVFLTVSCAGPNKVGTNKVGTRLFTKPDFSQDEYEKDREECNRSIDENLDSHAIHWQAFVDCLAKKGYTDQTSQDAEETKGEFTKAEEPPSGNKVLATAGAIALLIVLSPLIIAYGILLIGRAP